MFHLTCVSKCQNGLNTPYGFANFCYENTSSLRIFESYLTLNAHLLVIAPIFFGNVFIYLFLSIFGRLLSPLWSWILQNIIYSEAGTFWNFQWSYFNNVGWFWKSFHFLSMKTYKNLSKIFFMVRLNPLKKRKVERNGYLK